MNESMQDTHKREDDPRFPEACNRILRDTTPGVAYKKLDTKCHEALTLDEIKEAITALEKIPGSAENDPNRFDLLAVIHYSLNDRKGNGTEFLRVRFLRQVRRFSIDRFGPDTINENSTEA